MNAVAKKQTKFPRSKKKRIRKKWAKQDRNYSFAPAAYQWDTILVVHPKIAALIRNQIDLDPDSKRALYANLWDLYG